MKKARRLTILLLIGYFVCVGLSYAETIYTNDGQQIHGKVTEITEDTVWVETTEGDIIEEIGIEKSNVQKILNDDGSPFVYSPEEE